MYSNCKISNTLYVTVLLPAFLAGVFILLELRMSDNVSELKDVHILCESNKILRFKEK